LTRFLLAVAIIATTAVAFGVWSLFPEQPTFGGGPPRLLGLPSSVVLSVLAAATATIGLIWTIRIFRGPRDEPPPWRYRYRDAGRRARIGWPRRPVSGKS
jgi:hypothetical protein